MLLKVGAILASIPMALAAVVAGTGVAVVDVKQADGPHVMVPVPLLLAQAAASLAEPPAAEERVAAQLERARPYLAAAVEALDALAASPDAELVRVEQAEQRVLVRKSGRMIEVRVKDSGQSVTVNLPLDVARQALRQARDGDLSPAAAVGALRRARLTRLVDVQDGRDRVRVSIW